MTRTLGGMEIFGEISAGGMGSVFLAKKTGAHGFEKIVAVKTIRAELADRDDIRKLFLDEARLAARIEHPAVTQVYEFGEDEGTLFLAMEYIHGVSLEALLDKLGVIPAGIAARIGAGVCRGLHAAHETTGPDGKRMGVVHRDVSPPNVMITFDGGVKILDFGIALMKNRRAPNTQVGGLRGKLAYMAPEQVLGGTVDRRTDIYGTANVLFEITTGEKLRGDLKQHELATVFDQPLPRARDRGVPEVLDAIITRGLARYPEERFADARAMAIALDEVSSRLGGESLEEFAHRALAEEHAAHKQWIAELTGAAHPGAKTKRGPTLVATPGATRTLPLEDPPPPVKPRSKFLPVVFALIAVLLAASPFLLASSGEEPAPTESAHAKPIAPPVVEVQEEQAEKVEQIEPSAAIASDVKPRPRRGRARKAVASEAIEEKRELGFLTVGAEPYAVVLIDGREHGLTPLLKVPLETGSHRITLLDPASRSVRTSETIEIHADTLTKRLYR